MIDGEKNCNELYSCHEENEKKRCPVCGSLETKKHGFVESRMLSSRGFVKRKMQRFYCNQCHKHFTDKGYDVRTKVSESFKAEIVATYVTTKASLSEIAGKAGVSKTSICNWVLEEASRTEEFYEDGFQEPSGYIQIDGKEVRIKGRKRVILTASDSKTHRPICYGLYPSENKENSRRFLLLVKQIYGGAVIGITSDFGRGKCFLSVVREVFPDAKHQVCLTHFQRYLWLLIPGTKRSKYYLRNKLLKAMIRAIIQAETREESLERLNALLVRKAFFKASYHRRFLKSIERNYAVLTAHFDDVFLDTTSNVIENLNRQLARKLKNTDGFKSEESFKAFLKLWFLYRTQKIRF